jgi:hypothetical protein
VCSSDLKVMADDYGLRKPWEEQGRRY